MRIRGTKPEFWRSERVASVDWDARLVLKALESYVDDNGVGKDDIALICGDLFMRDLRRDASRTFARVTEAIGSLNRAGLVWRYEHEGTQLLYVSFWEQVQRVDKPQNGRNPRPDGTMNYGDSEIRESNATPRENSRTLAPGTEEQGNRGTGEQVSLSPDESDDREADTADETDTAGSLLPDEWRPNQRHVDKAQSLRLDVRNEYARFRDHATRTRRRQSNWNAAFTNWLRKSTEIAQQRGPAPSGPKTYAQQRQDNAMSLVERYAEQEKNHVEVGDGESAGVRALGPGRRADRS